MTYEANPQERERRRRSLYDAAMRLPQSERAEYVERIARHDTGLRDSVLRLLRASNRKSSGILDEPIYARAQRSGRTKPPKRVGAYTVVGRIGSGGMASVYACRGANGAKVAIKLLHSALRDAEFIRQFEMERAIHSRIAHPNVCRILDSGSMEDGTPFIVMEFVNGKPIDEYCRRRQVSLRDRLLLFSQVLAGVECFHHERIVHRDLKPPNILVTGEGRAKILDFGIAKFAAHGPGMTGKGRTKSPLPLMTIRYASPEQLQKLNSGVSSDIYALGLTLYELIAEEHPFADVLKQGTQTLLAAMANRAPGRPTRRMPVSDFTTAVDRITWKALQFDPGLRYASAGEFLDALGRCL